MSYTARDGLRLACVCLGCVVAVGCGRAKPVKLSGVVTLDGAPLSGATIMFVPMSSAARTATAMTDSSGKFDLSTRGAADGVVPGEYRVIVTVSQRDERWEKDPQGALQEMMDQRNKARGTGLQPAVPGQPTVPAADSADNKPASPVPAKYGNAQTTPLKVVVPVEGLVTLALTSDGT